MNLIAEEMTSESSTLIEELSATLADFDKEAQAFALATLNSKTGVAGLTLGAQTLAGPLASSAAGQSWILLKKNTFLLGSMLLSDARIPGTGRLRKPLLPRHCNAIGNAE